MPGHIVHCHLTMRSGPCATSPCPSRWSGTGTISMNIGMLERFLCNGGSVTPSTPHREREREREVPHPSLLFTRILPPCDTKPPPSLSSPHHERWQWENFFNSAVSRDSTAAGHFGERDIKGKVRRKTRETAVLLGPTLEIPLDHEAPSSVLTKLRPPY